MMDTRLLEIARDWRAARDRRDQAQEEMDHLEELLLVDLKPGDSIPGYLKVTPPPRRFDPRLAVLELPPDRLAEITVTNQVISLEKAKKYLTGEELDRCYREGKGRPVIREEA